MSISKNDNESAYTGSKKHWANVIKNTGDGNLLIWRQPEEDFNTNSTLIVMPGEEAIFIKNGQVETVSDNGTYNLKTDNYPVISRLRNLFTGGVSSFSCVIYFVRKSHTQEILWGTPNPMQIRDNVLGMMTNVQANGSFKIQIDNSVRFLQKLIGSNIQFETQKGLNDYFFNQFIQHITDSLQTAIQDSKEEIYRTFNKKSFIAENIVTPLLQPILANYGLNLVDGGFVISTLQFVNDGLRQNYEARIQKIGLDALEIQKIAQAEALGKKAEFDILDEKWILQKEATILKNFANNPGAGSISAANLGMGIATAPAFERMAQHFIGSMDNWEQKHNNQEESTGDSPFTKTNNKETQPKTLKEELRELKESLDEGYITEAEFDVMRKNKIEKFQNR